MKEFRLTTFDNPFNPFEQFLDWYLFDMEKGYNCCGLLDRIIKTSNDMTQSELMVATEQAIDEIIKNDFCDVYKKFTREIINDDN